MERGGKVKLPERMRSLALAHRHIFAVSSDLQSECEQLLKYGFNAQSATARQSFTRLAEHILPPGFQIY